MIEIKRGDIVIIALQGEHGKPRPAVVIQATRFADGRMIAIVPITSELIQAPLYRVDLTVGPGTGLRKASQAMLNMIISAPAKRIDQKIGRVDDDAMLEMSRKLAVFLGIAA